MDKKENKDKQAFSAGDWGPALSTGALLSLAFSFFCLLSNKANLDALNISVIDLSITYSMTFIGVLLTLYTFLQVITQKEWFLDQIAGSDPWLEFRENMKRVIRILFLLFLLSLIAKGATMSDLSEILKTILSANLADRIGEWYDKTISPILVFIIGVSIFRIYRTTFVIIDLMSHK